MRSRTVNTQTYLSPEEYRAARMAAAEEGLTLSRWIRELILRALTVPAVELDPLQRFPLPPDHPDYHLPPSER